MASVEIKSPKLLLVRPEDAANATEIFRIQMQEHGLDIEDELQRRIEERKMIEAGLITTAVDDAIETGVPIGRTEVEPCPECKGKRTIALLTSVVACKACEGSGEGEAKFMRYERTFEVRDGGVDLRGIEAGKAVMLPAGYKPGPRTARCGSCGMITRMAGPCVHCGSAMRSTFA